MSAPRPEPPPERGSPPSGQLGGLDKSSCVGRCDDPNLPDPPKNVTRRDDLVRRARLDLLRDAIHEAAGAAIVYAGTIQAMAEMHDDEALLLGIARLRDATLLACQAGRDIRQLREEAGR